MGFILNLEKLPEAASRPCVRRAAKTPANGYVISTGGYKRTVLARDEDRAVIVFFLKEQPQHVGFAISIRSKKKHGHDDVKYAYTPGIIAKHFPELICVEGRQKNSFRVLQRTSEHMGAIKVS